jgi:hypothetical protein
MKEYGKKINCFCLSRIFFRKCFYHFIIWKTPNKFLLCLLPFLKRSLPFGGSLTSLHSGHFEPFDLLYKNFYIMKHSAISGENITMISDS